MPALVRSGRTEAVYLSIYLSIYRAFLFSPMRLSGFGRGIDLLYDEYDPCALNPSSVRQPNTPEHHPEPLHRDDPLDRDACPTLRLRTITDHRQKLVVEFCQNERECTIGRMPFLTQIDAFQQTTSRPVKVQHLR